MKQNEFDIIIRAHDRRQEVHELTTVYHELESQIVWCVQHGKDRLKDALTVAQGHVASMLVDLAVEEANED